MKLLLLLLLLALLPLPRLLRDPRVLVSRLLRLPLPQRLKNHLLLLLLRL